MEVGSRCGEQPPAMERNPLAMRGPSRAGNPFSVRTWIVLTVLYAVAAGVHGVLAVRFGTGWQVGLAVVLLLVAAGLAVGAVRAAGRTPGRGARPSRPVIGDGDRRVADTDLLAGAGLSGEDGRSPAVTGPPGAMVPPADLPDAAGRARCGG